MKHQTSQILYAYWNEVRGNRIAPRRFDIEPARIGSILPETFILERIDNDTHRFRLAGTKIFEAFGIEFRGTNFSDLWSGNDQATVKTLLASLTTGGCVGRLAFEGRTIEKRRAEFEAVLMPLTHNSHIIDRIVGSISCIAAPAWLGTVRLDQRVLIENELIWPNGPLREPGALDERQAPFAPQLRAARLVRSERRNFRVYEGGLSKVDTDEA